MHKRVWFFFFVGMRDLLLKNEKYISYLAKVLKYFKAAGWGVGFFCDFFGLL